MEEISALGGRARFETADLSDPAAVLALAAAAGPVDVLVNDAGVYELTRTHTVVVPDLRGTGASDRPAAGYEKTNQAPDARGVLDALGLRRPAVVVGHDTAVGRAEGYCSR